MLNRLFKRSNDVRNAHDIYGSIVAMTRAPVLYTDIGITDTLDMRFELLMLHMFVFLHWLNSKEEDTSAVRQALVDRFFADIEATSRQAGVGDLAVPKKMRQMAAVFSERMSDYKSDLFRNEESRARALLETVFDDSKTAACDIRALQSYVSGLQVKLSAISVAELLAAEGPLTEDDLEKIAP